MPVSCDISGIRRAGNHAETSRSTLMNVIASPAPTSTLASNAVEKSVERASASWPAAMVSAPATSSRREPNRSSSTPTGICSAA